MDDTDGWVMRGMGLRLDTRPYAFALTRPLQTSARAWQQRRGWLLRIEDGCGCCGWGEVSPLTAQQQVRCDRWLTERIDGAAAFASVEEVEQLLEGSPAEVAFALGAALAELQGLVGAGSGGEWLAAPASALLLPAGQAMPTALNQLLSQTSAQVPFTVKWKVASAPAAEERDLLAWLLAALPPQSRLRLDANGGWDMDEAQRWAARLQGEPRLEWLEQPLAVEHYAGHCRLLETVPVALDEGLRERPHWRQTWPGWQVRRPVLEGDPRPLLRQLQQGVPRLMLSTAFETGIGARWLAHLSALQQQGPTPVAPGLAPGWCPEGALWSAEPAQVWAAAEAMA